MKLRTRAFELVAMGLVTWASGVLAQPRQESTPKPREASTAERQEMDSLIRKRFQAAVEGEIRVRAGGKYLFAGSDNVFAIKRSDVGSVLFEAKSYGITEASVIPAQLNKEELLKRVEDALSTTGLDAPGKTFAHFEDEFAGSTRGGKELPADFDPIKASKHVARTAAYERSLDGLPVFGSELLIGLNPDGKIGRFRLHWPKLDPRLVEAARRLETRLHAKEWLLPKELQSPGTEILEIAAGVGHSAFADPRFRSAAVVRVVFRTTGGDSEHPLATTGYKYFDSAGKAVSFTAFPRIPATSRVKKPRGPKRNNQPDQEHPVRPS